MLMEVAAWREQEAQARDVPRGRVLKDEVIGDLAVQAPTTLEKLAGLRSLPKGFERSKWGHDILEAVKRGLARDPKSLPLLDRNKQGMNGTATLELLKVLLRMTAERNGVAAKVIATVDDLEQIAAERRRRRAGAEGLAAGDVRREGDRAQAWAARARGREAPRDRGGAINTSLERITSWRQQTAPGTSRCRPRWASGARRSRSRPRAAR